MRFIRMALVSFAALAVVSTAKADILLEPYLGYGMGKAKLETTLGNFEWDNNNVHVGARLGWQFLVAMAGLDYSMPMSGKFKGTSTGANDGDYSGSTLWAFAGARLPLIRAYAGYGLMNTAEIKDTTGTTTLSGGTSMKVGGSFTGFPLIAVNVEYIMNDYKKIKSGGTESDIGSGTYTKAGGNVLFVSVSAPLSF